jgi:hypothetical protein
MDKIDLEEFSKTLPSDHPALTPSGKLSAAAEQVYLREPMFSRTVTLPPIALKTDNPVRNTELFYRIADMIEYFPEMYDQSVWGEEAPGTPCGTAFCIAGHAAHETGFIAPTRTYGSRVTQDWINVEFAVDDDTVVTETTPTIGRLELGLTPAEAEYLFHEDWCPVDGITVPEALRMIGRGEYISEVSESYHYREELERDEESRTIQVSGQRP